MKTIIIKLGGSLVFPPTGINHKYIKHFCSHVHKYARTGRYRIYIQVGGGTLSRMYISAGATIGDAPLNNIQLDWLGTYATHMNAHLIRMLLHSHSYQHIITDYTTPIRTTKSIIIAAGWKPGNSTDYNAVVLARTYHIDTIIKLTNVDYIYDCDPATNPQAQHFTSLTWATYRRLFSATWVPGQHTPFDNRASQLATRHKTSLLLMNGVNFDRLDKAIEGKSFIGTTITA